MSEIRWPRWRDQKPETKAAGGVRLFGPFECWRSPHSSWRLRRLNAWGPPPHAIALDVGRIRVVFWYRNGPKGAPYA